MLTAASALRWEIRRGLRWNVGLTFLGLVMIAGFTLIEAFYRRFWGFEVSPEHWRTTPAIHLAVTLINLGICLFGIGQGVGMSTRQYSLPVTSRLLATLRILPGAVCCAGLYLVLCTLFNVVFAADWPYLGPALTYGVSFMVMYATVYRFRGNDNRVGLAGLIMGTIIVCWVLGHYPRDSQDVYVYVYVYHRWVELTVTEVFILGLTALLSWWSLVDAIERDRRGAGWGRAIELPFTAAISAGTRRRTLRPFRSSATATFWLEWKQDGWLVPSVIIGLTALIAVWNVTNVIDEICHSDGRQVSFGHQMEMGALVFAFIPICFVSPWFSSVLGTHGKRAIAQRVWPTGQSTLPLSDATLGWIALIRCLTSTLVSLFGVLLVGMVWIGAVELVIRFNPVGKPLPFWPPNQTGLEQALIIAMYIAMLTFIGWIGAGLATAAALSGRRWIAAIPLGIVPVWIIVLLLGQGPLTWGTGTVLVCLLLWMFAAYSAGMLRGIIGMRSLLFGGLVFVFAEAAVIALWRWRQAIAQSQNLFGGYQSELIFFMAIAALAAAPPAIIPLATYYNRHR